MQWIPFCADTRCVSCSSISFPIIFVLFCSLDGGHSVVFEVSVKCEDDPYLCVFWRLGKMSIFWKGLELGREIMSLVDFHSNEIPCFFT